MINQLLYVHNKNKISEEDDSMAKKLLSLDEYHKFLKDMKEKNNKMHQSRLQR